MSGQSFIEKIDSDSVYVVKDTMKQLKNKVVIHISDYGDNYYDLSLIDTSTNSLFGDTTLCGIPGWDKAESIAQEISTRHNLKVIISKEKEEY